MPTDNDKDDPNKQGTGRLKDGLDAAGKLRPGAHIWWDRDYLPHVESTDLVQHVCFRLEDSLPRQVVQQMEAELMSLPPSLRSPEQEKRVNAYLDAGHGSCILRDPFIAELIDSTLLHFHGDRYTLYAWCIMPNHVHVLFQPEAGWTMSKIVASWKSFTGRRISAHRKELLASTAGLEPGGPKLGAAGPVWQREYFDRFMRDSAHFANTVNYIHMNPVKARLVQKPEDWPFSSASKSDDPPTP
ncbi:MAG: transposase [Flavobacteriales bacterium]|jgi:REP element-mobilizing transposase RayT|nr:transposase [Flavobacteriales bacterium]MBK7247123.1 transposase [Flavobacteriales bacterium]MBK7288739.1 transposase [Flavobacteriales bacterium]MBK9060204.1 transposase [Flavobacteriales bacterium]MBK9598859.1 transposase [Flavobacteriales bacterium]